MKRFAYRWLCLIALALAGCSNSATSTTGVSSTPGASAADSCSTEQTPPCCKLLPSRDQLLKAKPPTEGKVESEHQVQELAP